MMAVLAAALLFLLRHMPRRYIVLLFLLTGGVTAVEVAVRRAFARRINETLLLRRVVDILSALIYFIVWYLFAVYIYPGTAEVP